MIRLRELRKARGISFKDFLEKMAFSKNTLQRYERGEREPRATELSKMADVLGCTVDEILGRTERQETEEVIEVRQIVEAVGFRLKAFETASRATRKQVASLLERLEDVEVNIRELLKEEVV